MKKLLFAAHSLGMGGIETSLITLLEELVKKEYEITLFHKKLPFSTVRKLPISAAFTFMLQLKYECVIIHTAKIKEVQLC